MAYLKSTSRLKADKIYSDNPTGKYLKDNGTWNAVEGGGHTQGTDQTLDLGGSNEVNATQTKTAYSHSQSSHAPSDAQKNSDITKEEIEAKLIGEISTHTHAGGGGLSQAQVLTRML